MPKRRVNLAIYETDPMSRQDIINYASQIRRAFKVGKRLKFPVCQFFELFPSIFPECTTVICEDSEFDELTHGETDITNKIIKIKESVYNGAISNNGRDRATVLHEMCHYLLLVVNSMSLTRKFSNKKIPPYRDPEWQAKALAGELLMPRNLIRDLSPEEISKKCAVSLESATLQYNMIHNDDIRKTL